MQAYISRDGEQNGPYGIEDVNMADFLSLSSKRGEENDPEYKVIRDQYH